MNRPLSTFLKTLSLVALFATVGGSAFAQAGACINIQQGQTTSPHLVAGPWGGSRVNPGDSILIEQTENTYSSITGKVSGTAQSCRVIQNQSNNALFVPWKTATEWSAFIKQSATVLASPQNYVAPNCCPPLKVTLCGTTGAAVPLGYRVLGTPLNSQGQATLTLKDALGVVLSPSDTTTTNNWGEFGDTYGPICASIANNNSNIDYQVTYICTSNGTWTKTREIGSCTPVDGTCAVSAGATLSSFPSDPQTLCGTGSIYGNLAVQTNGAGVTTGWTWQCAGTPGMKTASCSATFSNASPGSCGTDNGKTLATLTSTDPNLCTAGTVASFKGNGPWTWSCVGIAGGATSTCSANYTNANYAACGSADGGAYSATQIDNMVTSNSSSLCSAGVFGTPAYPTMNGGGSSSTWYWYCSNASGSNYQYCSATNTTIDGACGADAGVSYNSIATPPSGSGLCYNKKSTASAVTYDSSTGQWTWTCAGINGGNTSPTCSATYNQAAAAGVCGTANKGSYTTLSPSDPTLCANGTPANFTTNGTSFTWTCDGANNGASVSCTATNLAANAQCGSADGNSYTSTPTTGLCGANNTASSITSNSKGWSWTCTNYTGSNTTSCSASLNTANTVAACGSATQNVSATAPTKKLCSGSLATSTTPVQSTDGSQWQWVCSLANGSTAACSESTGSGSSGSGNGSNGNNGSGTPGSCGTAKGQTSTLAPTANLCSVGTATVAVPDTTNTNWTWSCLSTNGSTTATCTAPMTLANGSCGLSNNTYIPNAPNNCPTCSLCLSGTASTVSGNANTGPWTWTCLGIGGGSSSPTCTANLCGVCTGSKSESLSATETITTASSCTITAQAVWGETDNLAPSGSSTYYTMSWMDALGTHNNTVYPTTTTYCPVCYAAMTQTTAPVVTITALSGSCNGYTVGQNIPVSVWAAK